MREHTALIPTSERARVPIHLRTIRARVAVLVASVALVALGPLAFVARAGADSSIAGYNASALGIGAQFAFNIPNLVPLPGENLLEEDVPFARTNVGQGPVVDSIGASYYPGDVLADFGSLLEELGAPSQANALNDSSLAHTQYPTSPSAGSQASFGESPSQASPASPSVFYSTSDATSSGGDATGYVTDVALDNVGSASTAASALPTSGTASQSLVDVGHVSATTKVSLSQSSITSTATSLVDGIQIAGLIDISGITSTASASSDGTTGTPTGSLHMGQVTVNGESAYIDGTGVHIASTSSPAAGITPAQLQQTVNATLGQDGITIALLSPTLTNKSAQASADTGGLQIAISHQLDVPFIPGEPVIPVPELGGTGLPAGLYTVTTSITLGLAQANVTATAPISGNSGNTGNSGAAPPPPAASTTSPGTLSGSVSPSCCTGNTGFTSFSGAPPQATTPPAEAAGTPAASPRLASSATSFPIRGIPPPLGWTITLLIGTLVLCYPLLLLARWQFIAPRRR